MGRKARTSDTFIVHGGLPSEAFGIGDLEAITPEMRSRLGSVLSPAPAAEEALAAGEAGAGEGEPAEKAAGGGEAGGGEGDPADEGATNEDTTEAAAVVRGVLWSDPAAGREHSGAVSNASRGGAGAIFGEDVTVGFLRSHGLLLASRAYELFFYLD